MNKNSNFERATLLRVLATHLHQLNAVLVAGQALGFDFQRALDRINLADEELGKIGEAHGTDSTKILGEVIDNDGPALIRGDFARVISAVESKALPLREHLAKIGDTGLQDTFRSVNKAILELVGQLDQIQQAYTLWVSQRSELLVSIEISAKHLLADFEVALVWMKDRVDDDDSVAQDLEWMETVVLELTELVNVILPEDQLLQAANINTLPPLTKEDVFPSDPYLLASRTRLASIVREIDRVGDHGFQFASTKDTLSNLLTRWAETARPLAAHSVAPRRLTDDDLDLAVMYSRYQRYSLLELLENQFDSKRDASIVKGLVESLLDFDELLEKKEAERGYPPVVDDFPPAFPRDRNQTIADCIWNFRLQAIRLNLTDGDEDIATALKDAVRIAQLVKDLSLTPYVARQLGVPRAKGELNRRL